MESNEIPQRPSKESVTFRINKSSRNVIIAKIFILVGLTLVGSHFFAQNAAQQYKQGRELTQEEYIERFDEYKGRLLNAKQYDNPLVAGFAMLMVLSFLIGSYELTALLIGFLIGKVIKR